MTRKNQNIPVKTYSPLMHPLLEAEKAFDRLVGWPISWHLRDISPASDLFDVNFEGARAPKIDVIDHEKEILVRAEVPGIDKKDIDVSLNENTLTIRAETNTEQKEEEGDYYRHEIASKLFARNITLPSNVIESKIKASLKDGVLEVNLPKDGFSKKKSITVN